jgi:hypothetical protein
LDRSLLDYKRQEPTLIMVIEQFFFSLLGYFLLFYYKVIININAPLVKYLIYNKLILLCENYLIAND